MTFFKLNGTTSMSKKNQTTSAAPTPAQTPRTSLSESRPSNNHTSNAQQQQQQTLQELMNKALNGRAGFCAIERIPWPKVMYKVLENLVKWLPDSS
ncbi:hypothetical protein BG005_001139 [Podila minutissima]|nr:hypothetical protein BG005_001139 [Podila minutissima]